MAVPLVECIIVILSLVITVVIGLYFSRQGVGSLKEYMLGGREMSVFPISLSIAATVLSGSSLVSTAQEVYLYGTQLALAPLIHALHAIAGIWVFLPVSYSIKSASSFAYFDCRFNRHIRTFASVIFSLDTIQHTAMSQYIPAVSVAQASGLPMFPVAVVLSVICLAYTATGGLRAVAWADSFQAILFIVIAVMLFVVGGYWSGGPVEIWRRASEGSRLELWNTDLSPSTRYTLMTLLISSMFVPSSIFLSPTYHQRIVAMPSLQQAKQVVVWSTLFQLVFLVLTYSTGIVIYSYFNQCDPVLAHKDIRSYSAILPYFVGQISEGLPGIEGMFLAGVLAAGLSTTTSCWNTAACTIYMDLISPFISKKLVKETELRIIMLIVAAICVASTSFILLIDLIGSLIEAAVILKSVTMCVNFVLYTSGMFLPWVNSKGVLVGSLTGGGLTYYIIQGAQRAKSLKLVTSYPKILSTANCLINGTTASALNMTATFGTTGYGMVTQIDPSVPWYFSLSIMLLAVPGALLGLLLALLVSWTTEPQDLATLDRNLIIPQLRWLLPSNPSHCEVPIDKMEPNFPLEEYELIDQVAKPPSEGQPTNGLLLKIS